MPTFLKESDLRSRVTGIDEISAGILLSSHRMASSLKDQFDVFLSHSIRDARLVLGIKRLLEDAGKSVYVDWINDPDLKRDSVNGETAKKLRIRMKQCTALIFAYSENSRSSRWMPWELGYFDGFNGNVAVLPIVPDHGSLSFENEEYLQIYPKIDVVNVATRPALFVNASKNSEPSRHKRFDEWTIASDKMQPL